MHVPYLIGIVLPLIAMISVVLTLVCDRIRPSRLPGRTWLRTVTRAGIQTDVRTRTLTQCRVREASALSTLRPRLWQGCRPRE